MYILSLAEVTAYGISGTDDQKTAFINQAESYIHNYCNVESFDESNGIEEEFHIDVDYILEYPNIRVVNTIGGVSATSSYKIDGQKVKFLSTLIYEANTDRNLVTIDYDGGFTTIPQSLKDAALFLVLEYAKTLVTNGTGDLKKISIGDLSEEYDVGVSTGNSSGISNSNLDKANDILELYKVLRAYSV